MGLHLTRRVPLQDVSIVRIARELKVSPGSVHYHLKGRSSLTTGIINQFYREMLERWPTPQGSWKSDVIAMATELHDHFCDYPGVAAYYVQHNRYDVLIPATSVEGGGVAMKFFEKYLSTLENSGLAPARTATFAVILSQFIHVTAHANAQHQWPGEHADLRAHLNQYDRKEFPSLNRLKKEFVGVTGDSAFKSGLELIVHGMEIERGC